MKFNELENKSVKDLHDLKNTLSEELFHLRIKNKTAQLTKKHLIQKVGKDLARVKHKMGLLAKKA